MGPRSWHFAISALLAALVLTELGCGGPAVAPGDQTREAKLGGMSCRLTIKSDHDTELNWAVTDRIVADFDGHHVEIGMSRVTVDSRSKPLPKGTEGVDVQYENKVVTVRADGKPLVGAQTK
jgi:hypothetical protein